MPLVPQIVRLHRQELTEGFLSSLGDRALSLMFEFAAESPAAVLLASVDDGGRVTGFLLGSSRTSGFYGEFLKRKSIRAAWHVAPKLLLAPSRIRRLAETLLYPARKEVSELPPAELMDLVIGREFQGRGIGRALFMRFSTILAERGIRDFRVTTGETLGGAHRFYERMGGVRVSDIEVHAGSATRVYICRTAKPIAGRPVQNGIDSREQGEGG